MARSERAPRRSDSLKGTVAAQRANSIIMIICIHKEDCEEEEERIEKKSWAAPMRQLHSATFSSCSACSLGPCWGSFGGMKTCSTTERRMLGSGQSESSTGEGMTVENKAVDVAMMRGRIDHPSPSPRPSKSHVFDVPAVSWRRCPAEKGYLVVAC